MFLHKGVIVHPDEVTKTWEKTVLGSDLNLFGIHPVGGNGSHVRVLELSKKGLSAEGKEVTENLIRSGVHMEYELHAMSLLLPRTLFTSHPEYFRLDEKGERNPDYNLCPSNGDALAIVSENASVLGKLLNPTDRRHHLWLDDVKGKRCHCPDCENLSASDQAMKIYNAILRGLRLFDPEAKACYLAYFDASTPPKKIMPDDGIFLEYAPFLRDFTLPMESEKNAADAANAKELIRLFPAEDAEVLEYFLDNSLYSGWKKPPKEFTLRKEVTERDLAFYDRLGYRTVKTFACYLGHDYEDLFPFPDLSGYLTKK